jgi:biotin synthase-like enzyme
MDKELSTTPIPDKELQELINQAKEIYTDNFGNEAWFGRCIFLSWYCERGTCTFCFRSVTKHTISHPDKARRSLASILAEAMLIKGMGWRIEFLTGGYGITNDTELLRMIKLVSKILDEKIWINLGEIGTSMLEELQPYVEGIVSSIETVEPTLHKQVCPDKPIQPFIDMMKTAKEKNFKLGMTIIIGLGEKKDDFELLKTFIEKNSIDRITIYALRPVAQTPFTKGPDSLDVAWWIAKTRITFPNIEIIAGSAQYRIPELNLLLNAGANALTKLPATKMINTKDGSRVEEEFRLAGRETQSVFHSKNPKQQANWDEMLNRAKDLTTQEKQEVMTALNHYLETFEKRMG